MQRSIRRSALAVVGGLLAAFLANVIAPPLADFLWSLLPSSFLQAHAMQVAQWTAILVAVFTTIVGGAVVGALAPNRPAAHALAVVVIGTVIVAMLTRTTVLPHLIQTATYLLQVVLFVATACLCFLGRHRSASGAFHVQPLQGR